MNSTTMFGLVLKWRNPVFIFFGIRQKHVTIFPRYYELVCYIYYVNFNMHKQDIK